MAHPVHVPDRAIVAALQRIEPTLSVDWMDPPGRWAVFHDLQVDGNFEENVDRVARVLQATASENGYVWSLHTCSVMARESLRNSKLVCYVTDDDGGYRSLDNRIVKKFEKMNHFRQKSLLEWKDIMNAKANLLRAQQERAEEDLWDQIRHDKVFTSQVSDILWGMKPMRSIYVKGVELNGNDESAQRPPEASSGSGEGA